MLNPLPVKLLVGGVLASALLILRDGIDPGGYAAVLGRRHGFAAEVVYRHALRGFAANLSDRAAEALRNNPSVLSVEPDRVAVAFPQNLPTGIDRVAAQA